MNAAQLFSRLVWPILVVIIGISLIVCWNRKKTGISQEPEKEDNEMNRLNQNKFLDSSKNMQAERLAWLWLLIGFVLLPFTFFQTVIPLAAWLAPLFLLRFTRTSRRPRAALALVFIAYALAVLIASRGLPFNFFGFLGNVLFKGLVWTLPYAIDRLLARRLQGWMRSLVFPLAFTSVDWVLSLLKVSSSGSPAYSQYGNLALLQLLSVTGMWGITFLIMWCAAVLNELWERRFDWRPLRSQLGLFAGVLAVVLLFGGLRLNIAAPASQSVEAATITIDGTTVQKVTDSIDWATFNRSSDAERAALRPKLAATVDQMLARSEMALRGGAKIVAWQESSAWVLEEDKPTVLEQAAALAKRYGAYLQVSMEVFTRTPSLPYLRNQSILIDPSGRILWTYDKTHPAPYDEAFVTISGPGKLPLVDTPYGRWSTAICYDTYFPALIRLAGKNNADILFAPTNDVHPYAASAIAMADYRAIENGFAMIRPTGNGVSAVVDPQGRVLASQDYFANSSGIMLASLPMHRVTTLYSRIGDAFAYLCVLGLILLAVPALLRREQPAAIAQRQPA
jgi:apolipoprotein N-acyltransferase